MEIKILFDSKKEDIRYFVGWGVSYLMNHDLLFDAGESEDMLFHNMASMNVRPEQIRKIVISHEHWDHVGGLWRLLMGNPGVNVYVCPGVSREFKDRIASFDASLIEVEPFMEIDRDMYTSGEVPGTCRYGKIPEQALILRSNKGITVVTGCAHDGIADILALIHERMPDPIHLVLGGFHTLDLSTFLVRSVIKRFQQMGVGKVAPTHCTGNEATRLFKEVYGADFVEVVVGAVFHV
ncbi:MAG: MBL fold metallo-hydrolase [Syntrophorhabdaceae bacterium]|nr:MBL fold metallo-hydrolase [Syntrophorhabdaceae bacterium]